MIEQNGLKKRKIPLLEMAFLMLFSVYYLLPSANNIIHFVIPMFIGAAYIIYVMCRYKKAISKLILFAFLIFFVAIAYTLLTDGGLSIVSAESQSAFKFRQFTSKLSQFFYMYLPVVFLLRAIKSSSAQKKTILVFMAVIIIFVLFQTAQVIAADPDALRHWEDFEELEDENVGNYYFVYSIPIIIVAISVCISKFNIIGKIISLCAIVGLLVFLVFAQYTLALLIAVIGIALQCFCGLKSWYAKGVLTFVLILFAFFIPDILIFVYSNVPSVQVAVRIREIYDFFTTGSLSGYNLGGRLTLYWKSIVAFLKSPIIGNRRLSFDGHATYLTVLADTGIIGGIPAYGMLFSVNKTIKKLLGENGKRFFPIFICYLLMGFTNPVHSSLPLSFAMFFIAPLMINTVYENKK